MSGCTDATDQSRGDLESSFLGKVILGKPPMSLGDLIYRPSQALAEVFLKARLHTESSLSPDGIILS